jgi:esterase
MKTMTLNFKRIGSGQPVILIHGLFGNLDNLGRLARHLSERFDVISIDLPNHGLSPHIPSVDYPTLSLSIYEFVESLHLTNVHVVGHSMGGKVAMQLAIDYPHLVKSLTVADIAPVLYTDRHANVFSALNAIDISTLTSRTQALEIVTSHNIDAGTAQFLLKNLAKNENGFFWRCSIENLQQSYPQIIAGLSGENSFNGSTLFIKGENSDYINAQHRPAIMQYFPQANAKIIQGTGHWLHAEKPASFNKIVVDFIDKNSE